jgi:hypothetical protein
MLSTPTYRRIVRASAIYDLVVTAPFATPWTFTVAHGHLSAINVALRGMPLPDFAPLHVLFACLMGTVVMLWAVLRITDPQPRFGRYDGTGRLAFAVWMGWALALTGMPVLWLFIAPEVAWAIAQWLPHGRAQR